MINADDSEPEEAEHESCETAKKTMGLVCKKCKLAFPEEPAIIEHLKSSDCNCGVVRLVQCDFLCKRCDARFPGVGEWRAHFAQSHRAPNLSDEMEDVVNQITALAAKAAAADSNANLFCAPPQGPEPKSKLFVTPNSVPVPSTGK